MASEDGKFTKYDKIYKGTNRINLDAAFNEYREFLKTTEFYEHYKHHPNEVFKKIGNEINEEKFNVLVDFCDIGQLNVYSELDKMTKHSFEYCKDPLDNTVLNDLHLETLKCANERMPLKSYQKASKYTSEKPVHYEVKEITPDSDLVTPEHEFTVDVRVYLPYSSKAKQSSGAIGKLVINYVITILGSQTLDKLRDKISCTSELSISKETSKLPIIRFTENAKDVYKSGFFFIEDTFYNDFRDPKNIDYSEVIRKWGASKGMTNFKTAKMEETRIDSLNLKFGFPWVYQHQGDCEHLIVFSDASLISPSDELDRNCYPRIVRIKPQHSRYCMTCGMYCVNWVTTSNNRLPHNPCFFCDSCFKSYNYIDGQKIGKFNAYPYPSDTKLLQNEFVQVSNEKNHNLTCLESDGSNSSD